jgi:hypothetical protein
MIKGRVRSILGIVNITVFNWIQEDVVNMGNQIVFIANLMFPTSTLSQVFHGLRRSYEKSDHDD